MVSNDDEKVQKNIDSVSCLPKMRVLLEYLDVGQLSTVWTPGFKLYVSEIKTISRATEQWESSFNSCKIKRSFGYLQTEPIGKYQVTNELEAVTNASFMVGAAHIQAN